MTVHAKHGGGSEWRICRADEPGAVKCEVVGYLGHLAQVRVPGGGILTVGREALHPLAPFKPEPMKPSK